MVAFDPFPPPGRACLAMTAVPRPPRILGALLAAACALGGCAANATSEPEMATGDTPLPPVSDGLDPNEIQVAPAEGCDQMDVLFVIDNSRSMREEQTNLVENFPRFIEVLDGFRDGTVDYRVAVTTTGLDIGPFDPGNLPGENGALLSQGDCQMTSPWLDRGDAQLLSRFACNAEVGVTGSSNEMPLLAARMALRERMLDGTNHGFLRDNALLAIVIVTDEDDQSLDVDLGGFEAAIPVSAFVTAFDEIKGNPKRWASAVIAGDQQPVCESDFGTATNALKLQDFVGSVGENAVFSSICEGDLSAALSDALSTFEAACEGFPLI